MKKFNTAGDYKKRSSGAASKDFKKEKNRSSSSQEMFKTLCSECGNSCEVPFKPIKGKPVFCDNCFKAKSGNDQSGFKKTDRRDSFDKKMFKSVCSECGDSCELPFRPTGDKPVFCSFCFEKNGDRKNVSLSNTDTQLEKLNQKLDRIITLLEKSIK